MDKIVWAIKNGDLDQVKQIVDAEPFDVNAEMSQRYPVHIAADYGQADVLTYLLERGAQVDVSVLRARYSRLHLIGHFTFFYVPQQLDKHGISPLLAAIWEGHTGCVRVLLEHGANKSGTTPDGQSYEAAAEKAEIKVLLR